MNILVVLVVCLLMYNLYSHRGVKGQKGGVENTVVVGGIIAAALAGGAVGLYFLLADKTCKDVKKSCGTGKKFIGPEDKKCENTTKCKEKCCEDKTCAEFTGACVTTKKPATTKCTTCNAAACCEKAGGGGGGGKQVDGKVEEQGDIQPSDIEFTSGSNFKGHTIGNYKPAGTTSAYTRDYGDRTAAFVEGDDMETRAKNCYLACTKSSPMTGAQNAGGKPYCTLFGITENNEGSNDFVGECNGQTRTIDPETKQINCGKHNCQYSPSGSSGSGAAAGWALYGVKESTLEKTLGEDLDDFYKVGSE